MKRSIIELVVIFALAILGASLTADAQQPRKIPRIGFLHPRHTMRGSGKGCASWATSRHRPSRLNPDLPRDTLKDSPILPPSWCVSTST